MITRLDQQIAFLNEADKLKSIRRATVLADRSRAENSAEHSWHLTLYALVLADQAKQSVDISRVIKMLILHDLVEIDAGDNPIFGNVDVAAMEAAEQNAANRIFGILPNDLRDELYSIWKEFETAQTDDAQFAKSLDRFQPPMLNLVAGGGSWTEYNVTEQMIEDRIGSKIKIGAPALWDYARAKISAFFKSAT
jgi:putative hydrolase of HD superfamily